MVPTEAAFEINVADYIEKHMIETLDHRKIHDTEKHEVLAVWEALKPAALGH